MNDSFATQIIRQAKIEGSFQPGNRRAKHETSILLGRHPIFWGAFSAYLQNAYGMDSYAEFWEEVGKLHFFGSLESIVAKVYGKNLRTFGMNLKILFPYLNLIALSIQKIE